MDTKTEKIIKLCKKIIKAADNDLSITIDGNDVNSSEARVVAEKILRILGVDNLENM